MENVFTTPIKELKAGMKERQVKLHTANYNHDKNMEATSAISSLLVLGIASQLIQTQLIA